MCEELHTGGRVSCSLRHKVLISRLTPALGTAQHLTRHRPLPTSSYYAHSHLHSSPAFPVFCLCISTRFICRHATQAASPRSRRFPVSVGR